MLSKLLAAWCLMAACVVIHAAGIASVIKSHYTDAPLGTTPPRLDMAIRPPRRMDDPATPDRDFTVGRVYEWTGAMPDLTSALYFSAVTYTTTGYGDVVLPEAWRLVGGIEALTGILMCGLSTGFFFAVVSRMFPTRV